MKLLVALICGVTLAFAQDVKVDEKEQKIQEAAQEKESKDQAKQQKDDQKIQAAEQKTQEKMQSEEQKEQAKAAAAAPSPSPPPSTVSSARSAVQGKLGMHVTKNVRRLLAQSGTGFAKDKNAVQAAKQTIAKAAHTEADKVKVHVHEPSATGRRLIGEEDMVIIHYILEAANSTDAQAKHDLLENTALTMFAVELTNALVAQGDPIYTVQVSNHTVTLASQDDLAAFESEDADQAAAATPSPSATASTVSSATSGVKGSLEMHVTKNVRRLQAQNGTGFANDKKAAQAAKQTVAKAAHTEAEKVKVNVHGPSATGRRLVGETDVVSIDYIVEAANSTDAQAKHDLLKNTAESMLAVEFTNALVAQGDAIYTVQVNNHTVALASQDDLAAFEPEVSTKPGVSAVHDKSLSLEDDGKGGASWVYWAMGALGVAALALCAYFCISASQKDSKDKKKKKKESTKRGVELSAPAEAPLETASLAANPSPTPMYQPQANPVAYQQQPMYSVPQFMPVQQAQYMQPVQYAQYSQLAQPVQYVQNVQVGQMEPMAMASPVQYG